jgi:hypothetical protein
MRSKQTKPITQKPRFLEAYKKPATNSIWSIPDQQGLTRYLKNCFSFQNVVRTILRRLLAYAGQLSFVILAELLLRLRGIWQTRPLEPATAVGAPVAPLFLSHRPEASHSKSSFESPMETAVDCPARGCEISFLASFLSTLHRRLAGLYRCFCSCCMGSGRLKRQVGFYGRCVCFLCS